MRRGRPYNVLAGARPQRRPAWSSSISETTAGTLLGTFLNSADDACDSSAARSDSARRGVRMNALARVERAFPPNPPPAAPESSNRDRALCHSANAATRSSTPGVARVFDRLPYRRSADGPAARASTPSMRPADNRTRVKRTTPSLCELACGEFTSAARFSASPYLPGLHRVVRDNGGPSTSGASRVRTAVAEITQAPAPGGGRDRTRQQRRPAIDDGPAPPEPCTIRATRQCIRIGGGNKS